MNKTLMCLLRYLNCIKNGSRGLIFDIRMSKMCFSETNKSTKLMFTLDVLQVIDVKRSYVTMTATKIEITMRKAEPMQWASLELPTAKKQEKQKEEIAD